MVLPSTLLSMGEFEIAIKAPQGVYMSEDNKKNGLYVFLCLNQWQAIDKDH